MTAQKKANRQTNKTTRDRIGVIFYGAEKTADFFKKVYKGIQLAASALDAKPELLVRYSPMDPIQQVKYIDELVNEGIKGLVISPVDDRMVADTINKISHEGIPVVTVHTDIADTERIAYVGTDPYKAGEVAAAQMLSFCEDGTEIGIVTGSRQIKVHEQRIAGFRDFIKHSKRNITVESIGECHDDDYRAYELVQKMMSDNPVISAFFFATTGGIYGGCKGIFTMTTRLKFHVVTLDVFPATREFMKKGLIDCSVYQSPMHQGAHAMDILAGKIYENRDPEKRINYEELSIKTKECLYL